MERSFTRKMVKKCTKDKHNPDWDDYEVIDIDKNKIQIECNCECWKNVFMREFILDGEYILKEKEYIPI